MPEDKSRKTARGEGSNNFLFDGENGVTVCMDWHKVCPLHTHGTMLCKNVCTVWTSNGVWTVITGLHTGGLL